MSAGAVTRVFYSWQKDLPNTTNRAFIGKALDRAIKAIREDKSIQVDPVLDRDTAGVGGAPDIAATIFGKIDDSAVFVADVSIIGKAGSRPTPNPNVLIELGYAKKALGPDRVLLVMNTAFGTPEELPFDLRPRKVILYNVPDGETDRAGERAGLQARLEAEIRVILARRVAEVIPTARDQTIEAIEKDRPDRTPRARRFATELMSELSDRNPDLNTSDVAEAYERLLAAIGTTAPSMTAFARLANTVADHDAADVAAAVYQAFSPLLDRYDVRPETGNYYSHQFDFFRFIGHEMMVMLFAPLVREERWTTIAAILDRDIAVRFGPGWRDNMAPFSYASRAGDMWRRASAVLRKNRASLHYDLLNERHSQGLLGEVAPMSQFMAADYLLFLRSVLSPAETPDYPKWAPWSCLGLRDVPAYLAAATRVRGAEELLRPLGVSDIAILRSRLGERMPLISRVFPEAVLYWIKAFDANQVGAQP